MSTSETMRCDHTRFWSLDGATDMQCLDVSTTTVRKTPIQRTDGYTSSSGPHGQESGLPGCVGGRLAPLMVRGSLGSAVTRCQSKISSVEREREGVICHVEVTRANRAN